MTEEVTGYLASLDEDKDTGCFVLTGTGKAFAAGAISKKWRKILYGYIL